LGGHGTYTKGDSRSYLKDQRGDKSLPLGSEALADIIKQEINARNLPADIPVFLASCNAGKGSNSLAFRLSKKSHNPFVNLRSQVHENHKSIT
jgi:hypothetical protein